jgi:hypothetical protein
MIRRNLALILVLPATACALVQPIFDGDMSSAPRAACLQLVDAPAGAPQCLSILRRGPNNSWLPLDGNRLQAGDEWSAVRVGPASCQGDFTHLVVTGNATGPGAMRVQSADVIGRGVYGRDFHWRDAQAGQSWVVRHVSGADHAPGAVLIQVSAGSVDVQSICYKTYHH